MNSPIIRQGLTTAKDLANRKSRRTQIKSANSNINRLLIVCDMSLGKDLSGGVQVQLFSRFVEWVDVNKVKTLDFGFGRDLNNRSQTAVTSQFGFGFIAVREIAFVDQRFDSANLVNVVRILVSNRIGHVCQTVVWPINSKSGAASRMLQREH